MSLSINFQTRHQIKSYLCNLVSITIFVILYPFTFAPSHIFSQQIKLTEGRELAQMISQFASYKVLAPLFTLLAPPTTLMCVKPEISQLERPVTHSHAHIIHTTVTVHFNLTGRQCLSCIQASRHTWQWYISSSNWGKWNLLFNLQQEIRESLLMLLELNR